MVAAAPDNDAAYLQRAHIHFCLGDNDSAIKDYSRAISLAVPPNTAQWTIYRRANPLWMTGEFDKAAADYREFRRLAGPGSYADARLYLLLCDWARQLQQDNRVAKAQEVLRDAQSVLKSGRRGAAAGEWIEWIFRHLVGECSSTELVNAADPSNREQLCEAYYYAGEVCWLNGRINEARTYFQKCVGTDLPFDLDNPGLDPMSEYHLARWRLARLADHTGAASEPSGE